MEEIKKEPVTALLILLNILIFLIVEFTGGSENGQHMLECGACYAPLILEQGEWYRVFFSMFLHFGAPHLINNILVLFVLGQRLEPAVGKLKFLLIYIAGGLGGNLISLFWDIHTGDYSVSAGASGAVFALMGGYDLCDYATQRKSRRSYYTPDAYHGSIFSLFWIRK